MPQIILTPQESEEFFYNAICNGLGYVTTGYGLELDYDRSQYKQAKASLIDKSPCFEDVFMEMLRMGFSLTLEDVEGDGDNTKSITMKDVHEWVSKTPFTHLSDMIMENDDAETADIIIQTVFFNDVIFG